MTPHPPHPAPKPLIIPPGAGDVLRAFGEEVTVKLSAAQSRGALSLWLESTPPGGFETYFARCAEVFTASPAPDMNRIIAISAEHGIHFDNPG